MTRNCPRNNPRSIKYFDTSIPFSNQQLKCGFTSINAQERTKSASEDVKPPEGLETLRPWPSSPISLQEGQEHRGTAYRCKKLCVLRIDWESEIAPPSSGADEARPERRSNANVIALLPPGREKAGRRPGPGHRPDLDIRTCQSLRGEHENASDRSPLFPYSGTTNYGKTNSSSHPGHNPRQDRRRLRRKRTLRTSDMSFKVASATSAGGARHGRDTGSTSRTSAARETPVSNDGRRYTKSYPPPNRHWRSSRRPSRQAAQNETRPKNHVTVVHPRSVPTSGRTAKLSRILWETRGRGA